MSLTCVVCPRVVLEVATPPEKETSVVEEPPPPDANIGSSAHSAAETQDPSGPPKKVWWKDWWSNYPISIWFIVVHEFCEAFSLDGIKAVLTLYFLTYLHWGQDLSTAAYHAFSSLCYFMPIVGALVADSWLGNYKTIFYMCIVYIVGHAAMLLSAIPPLGGSIHIASSLLGLTLIACGTGCTDACTSAFGGDQFQAEHVSKREKFFSIYFSLRGAGSFLAIIIVPILRDKVQCFGDDCFAAAFVVPAAFMIVAFVVFAAGRSHYRREPPQGNILKEVCKCIGFAVTNRWRRSKHESSRKHWLDWAEDKYSKRLILEIKMVFSVLVLFIPLPMFWALFDQQGSRWTLQATKMNMSIGALSVTPDQMQLLNPLLNVFLVPIFGFVIYPLVDLCGIKTSPLRKMAVGMVFAVLAFGVAALVEVSLMKTMVEPAPAGKSLLQVFNLRQGDVRLGFPNGDPFPDPIPYLQDPPQYVTLPLGAPSSNISIDISFNGASSACDVTFAQQEAYSLILHPLANGVQCSLVHDDIRKDDEGAPLLRFVNTLPEAVSVTVGHEMYNVLPDYSVSTQKAVAWGEYNTVCCRSKSQTCSDLNLGLLEFGASYTFILGEDSGRVAAHKMVDVQASNVSIAWQIPQYLLITAGEVMFSVTGLEFAYSQAPANMKAVLLAAWLLTAAFGDIIVLIVAKGAGLEQWEEFLLFAGLLLGVVIMFSCMACFYTDVQPEYLDQLCPEGEDKRRAGEDEREGEDEHAAEEEHNRSP
ncbi:solute carrier family 15 member 2-like isoform X1 [Dunckerocampus dactyliophorus]|uniref:solute carrier family 15 member 2-like isoform X1 n=1 Tax=Dunckerocampus dactyliophorus TaxID=161453 RepID=UPI0024062BDE|nr:solute carrier family 15 member 2-like isoform X1 [Dunckerocampus dactyliophorus]